MKTISPIILFRLLINTRHKLNFLTSRMHMFAEFIDECHQLELESYGLPYTWLNKRSDSSSIFEKLDRVLINYQ